MGSLYMAFEPSEAKRIMDRQELVYTPKHGSWRGVAELELSVLTRQSLSERLGSEAAVAERAGPWAQERNRKQIGVGWQFTTQDARTKLIAVFVRVSGLLRHRIFRADLPIAGIPDSHTKTAINVYTRT